MSLFPIVADLAQDETTTPAAGPDQRTGTRNPVILRVQREGVTGTVAVYGADLPGKGSANYNKIKATAAQTVDTDITYAAFSNYNWIVKRNGVILTQAASPADLTEFAVADNSGVARITIGDGTPTLTAGDIIEVFFVTPVELYEASAEVNAVVQITSRELLWAVGSDTGSFSPSDVTVEPLIP